MGLAPGANRFRLVETAKTMACIVNPGSGAEGGMITSKEKN